MVHFCQVTLNLPHNSDKLSNPVALYEVGEDELGWRDHHRHNISVVLDCNYHKMAVLHMRLRLFDMLVIDVSSEMNGRHMQDLIAT